MKAALYIRVSTDKQASEGNSLEVQEEKLRKFCNMHYWELHQLYADRGISGKDTERPQFQQLMRDAREKRFDVIVVSRQTGFSSNIQICWKRRPSQHGYSSTKNSASASSALNSS